MSTSDGEQLQSRELGFSAAQAGLHRVYVESTLSLYFCYCKYGKTGQRPQEWDALVLAAAWAREENSSQTSLRWTGVDVGLVDKV